MAVLSSYKNGYKCQQNVAFLSDRCIDSTTNVKTESKAAIKIKQANNQSAKKEFKNRKSNINVVFRCMTLNELAEIYYIPAVKLIQCFQIPEKHCDC